MPDSSLEVAAAAAERIRSAVAGLQIPAGADPGTGILTISGGVAFSLAAREHWEAVLAAADVGALRGQGCRAATRSWSRRPSSTSSRQGSARIAVGPPGGSPTRCIPTDATIDQAG